MDYTQSTVHITKKNYLVNLMDYTALKKMNEDCLFISTKLNQEIEKVNKHYPDPLDL